MEGGVLSRVNVDIAWGANSVHLWCHSRCKALFFTLLLWCAALHAITVFRLGIQNVTAVDSRLLPEILSPTLLLRFAGLHAMTALKAGARHVTAVERWLYLSSAAQEALVANGFPQENFTVVYKRPTDLALIRDVPVVCNLLICDIMDEGVAQA